MQVLDSLRQEIAEHPWRAGLYAFALVAVLTALLVVTDSLLRPDSFPVRKLSFEGEFQQVQEQALASAVMESVRGNFFRIDLDAVRQRAQRVPWVHRATVQRRWPDGVHVRFTEQQLAARWGAHGWVNVHGEAVDLQGRPGPAGLPQLSGPEGLQAQVLEHYRRLSEILAPLGLHVATLNFTARHSWTMVLSNGIQLVLGREQPEPKVERFVRAYPRALAAQATRIRRVDLRYTNGFSVEWAPRAAMPRAADSVPTGLNEG